MKENKKIKGLDFTWREVRDAIKNNRLLSFDLEFSRRCDLNCLYCYSRKNLPALDSELTFKEIKNIINQAVKLGAKNVVNIGGGEPMLRKDYWKILAEEKKLGLKSITFTNGTLINKKNAEKLFNIGESIALKFNSFNTEIQDFLAGVKGTGEKIKIALQNLVDVGYARKDGPNLALETVICRQNYNEIERIYKFCRENNIIPYVEILTEQGLVEDNALEINVTPQENMVLFSKLLKYDKENFGIDWPLTPPIVGQTCKRMLYSAYITSTGNVQPCPGVEITNSQSNIRNHSLRWILKNSEVFKKVRHIFNNLKGHCAICEYKDCYGCRGTALFQNGCYLESDPSCWNIKMSFNDIIKKFNIKIKTIKHKLSGKTTEQASRAVSASSTNILKSLLFKSKTKNYLGVIISGDKLVDLKKIKTYFKQKKINIYKGLRMADTSEIKIFLGYEIGGVTPFAFYRKCLTLYDASLTKKEYVIGSKGDEFTGIKFNPREFEKLKFYKKLDISK